VTRAVGIAGGILYACAVFLFQAGAGLMLLAILLAAGFGEPILGMRTTAESASEHWFAVFAIAGIGAGIFWFAAATWRVARRHSSLNALPAAVRLVDADLLAVRSFGRGMKGYSYAFEADGQRWLTRQTMTGFPLALDPLQSRGVVALGGDGPEGILLGQTAHPLKMEAEARRNLLTDIALYVDGLVEADLDGLRALEARLSGREARFVRLYLEACEETDPARRKTIALNSLSVAAWMSDEKADEMLHACRKAASGR